MNDADRIIAEMLKNNPELSVVRGVNVPRPMPEAARQALKALTPTEHEEQVALFQWAEANTARYPALARLVAIPNGGFRHPATAAALKQEGVRAGVPDIVLFAQCWNGDASERFGAMFIELKRANHRNHATPEQEAWISALNEEGY